MRRAPYRNFINIAAWAGFFIVFTILAVKGVFKNIDTAIADTIVRYASHPSDKLFSLIRSLGHLPLCGSTAFMISIYAFFKGSRRFAIFLFAAFIFLVGTGYTLKNMIKKERPSGVYYRYDPWYFRIPEDPLLYGYRSIHVGIVTAKYYIKEFTAARPDFKDIAEKARVEWRKETKLVLLDKELKRMKEEYIKKSYSYPSGHSSRTIFLFLVIGALAGRTRLSKKAKEAIRGVLYALIISVGLSSIYLGAHWLSDIIGASLLGYIFFLSLKILVDKDQRM